MDTQELIVLAEKEKKMFGQHFLAVSVPVLWVIVITMAAIEINFMTVKDQQVADVLNGTSWLGFLPHAILMTVSIVALYVFRYQAMKKQAMLSYLKRMRSDLTKELFKYSDNPPIFATGDDSEWDVKLKKNYSDYVKKSSLITIAIRQVTRTMRRSELLIFGE